MVSIDEDRDDSGFELPDAHAPNPEQETSRHEERERLQALLKNLEVTDRAAIVLRYWHEYSEAEIADTLHLTVSAVKSRLHRARRQLAGLWQGGSPQPKSSRRTHESPAF
jgi:RNA polymerase sigma-70 factor (ECF subfamily)